MAKKPAQQQNKPLTASDVMDSVGVDVMGEKEAQKLLQDGLRDTAINFIPIDPKLSRGAVSYLEASKEGQSFKAGLENLTHGLYEQGGGIAAREAALMIAGNTKHLVPEQYRPAVEVATSAAIALAHPAKIMLEAKEQDELRRGELREKLAKFEKEYGENVRGSSANPLGRPKNSVLTILEEQLTDKFSTAYAPAATSLTIGTAQIAAHKMHNQDFGVRVDNLVTESELQGDKLKAFTAETDKLKQGTRSALTDLFNQPFSNNKKDALSDLIPYDNQVINKTTGAMLGSSWVGSQIGGFLSGDNEKSETIIAAELILHLAEQVKKDGIGSGKVHLDGLNLPKDVVKAHKDGMPLDEYIELIFRTNVHDMNSSEIPDRFNQKLRDASHEIANSIVGKNSDLGNESTLNPLALIELVGSGKIVAHDGLHVANDEIVRDEVKNALSAMPITPQMDTYQYVDKLGNKIGLKPDEAVDNLKNNLRMMDSETRDFVALLVPTAVLVQELDLPQQAVNEAKERASEYALENVKQVLSELSTRSDKELLEDGLSKAQLKVIHENYAHMGTGDDDKILQSLRQRDETGLGFAILSSKSYMQELAGGKKLTGLEAVPEEKLGESTINPATAEIADASIRVKAGELVRAS